MRTGRGWLGLCLALGTAALLRAAERPAASWTPSTDGKKLIEYGWDCPTPFYVRQHVETMEQRPFDGIVIQNLSTSPSFFASTTILIIGGLLATLGTTEKASELVREFPFAARTSVLVFDLKIVLMLAIYVYAFFRFTWSMRQYTFGALLIASAPEAEQFEVQGLSREAFADKAGRVVALAAETFNDGLRAYYFAFAAIGWFFSPLVFMLGTAGVVYILFQREFHSDMLDVLNS